MSEHGLAFCIAVLGWWLSTGAILYLNHQHESTYRWSALAATVLLVFSLSALPHVSQQANTGGAITGFCLTLAIWGWLEMTYLMGILTGTHNQYCPANLSTGERFKRAIGASIYHEIAIVVLGSLIIALSWGGGNQVATWSFITLWLMRWSAKLNMFLGVRNYNHSWLPERLSYLDSYVKRKTMNPLFPFSVVLGSAATAWFFHLSMAATSTFGELSNALVGVLLALAVLEHVFLMLPLGDAALWRWVKLSSKD
ncbi:putative photosynthetic complex assembly protein 2 [Luminiphilus syltensis NOR5-1B]|uniref:Putative photosynthetic complex assembly protein 2 n=1 Tax=Luminiphilus syltensis NOR5-1B TaxID=565045 RepID=B8KT31_9GAMM|nr:putative photosynthetic complex assembly protein PuhE [Luminiphilus syltensis]EED34685.1 putative photosynthetic complex assembly protein 2 [Luminiphilus syltensis NOR5-1B]